MPVKAEKRERPEQDAPLATDAEFTRQMVEEQLPDRDVESLSEEEIVQLSRKYKLSAPIRIPQDKLDPNYEYRWINLHPKVYRKRRAMGWKPVTRDLLEKVSKVPVAELDLGTHFDPDGTLRCDTDLIFCYMSKRVAQALQTDRIRQNQQRLSAGKRRFHDSGVLTGVETFEKDVG